MHSSRALAKPAYCIATLLVVLPLVDGVASVWPFRFGQEAWRFGAVGSLGNIVLVELLGFFLALAVAIELKHATIRRAIGWTCGIAGAALVVTVVIFVLDFVQTRATADPRLTHAIDAAAIPALVKLLCTIVAFALLSGAALSVKTPSSRSSSSSRSRPPLIPLSDASRVD